MDNIDLFVYKTRQWTAAGIKSTCKFSNVGARGIKYVNFTSKLSSPLSKDRGGGAAGSAIALPLLWKL